MNQKFSKDIFADKDAFYMSCPERIAKYLANQLRCFETSVELCTAVGVTAIQLAFVMKKVIAVDKNAKRIADAIKNAEKYGVGDRIQFIVGNVLDNQLLKNLSADVAILDPDWSFQGKEKTAHVQELDDTQPSMKEMFERTRKYITPNIVLRMPNTFTRETLSCLGPCLIENIFWGDTLRFKFAYYLDNTNNYTEKNIYFDE
jgi:trimethylguanosine synthase